MSRRDNLPHIKICGLRDSQTILAMDHLPITEVGLVFAPSKRQVTIQQGAALCHTIKQLSCREGLSPSVAGVFVNYPLEQMMELLHEVPLDIVQLHGQESLEYYESLYKQHSSARIWKVVSIHAQQEMLDASGIEAELKPFLPYIEGILLDAPGGGTGHTFNWSAIESYRKVVSSFGKLLIVAGGLNVNNVAELIESYPVDGIDVSSGVETDGVKDITKIHEFVRKVIEA